LRNRKIMVGDYLMQPALIEFLFTPALGSYGAGWKELYESKRLPMQILKL